MLARSFKTRMMAGDHSAAHIGALAIIRPDWHQAILDGLHKHDLTTQNGLNTFADAVNVDIGALEGLGHTSMTGGCAMRYAEREYVWKPGRPSILVFRHRNPAEDLKFEFTLMTPYVPEEDRLKIGPKAGLNTCALDVVIYIAIQAHVARVRVDQLAPAEVFKMSAPRQIFRQFLVSDLATYGKEGLAEARDLLADALSQYRPTVFPRGSFQSVQSVLDELLGCSPLFSWNSIQAYHCCDNVFKVTDVEPERECCINIGIIDWNKKPLMSTLLTSHFSDPSEGYFRPNGTCENRKSDKCTWWRETYRHLVIDRLPPFLLVHFPESTLRDKIEQLQALSYTHNIQVRHHGDNRMIGYTVRPRGAIFHINQNHFVARWHTQGPGMEGRRKMIDYDDLRSPSTREVDGWWDSLNGLQLPAPTSMGKDYRPSVVSIVYRCEEMRDKKASQGVKRKLFTV